ncbi:thiamine pyrophosphate-dependent enzyme [Advenella mimigardefordensis]|uniref:TPP-binding domain-containing protein n=1 Tax=Advenella mimigardefordensis (strain DSM 17166 / LMG 22922 / DPN7) TaxID=1247726 RepID=W0PFK9_ADVMD|nr:thiamine pyrophosphate-dependent enzyme [Advenella mimigardefordensis]AHG63843.1 TPP-binding domain-containing protein [Advenella mimigardefordensis DPN7]
MNETQTITGGQALVSNLINKQVEDLFMIPGIQLDWAVDALRQRSDAVRLYIPRHEQTTTYMADGYYRATGKVGAAMVVPGPGALNAGAGLATAYASNSKVLFITGQIHSSGIGKGCGLLHEIKDQTGFVRGLTKWNHLVSSAQDIAPSVDQAFHQLQSGRPRPVGLEIPHDFLSERLSGQFESDTAPLPLQSTCLEESFVSELDQAAQLIDQARFPVIYVGGGIISSNATEELAVLANKIHAPVVMSDNGRGALSDRHPLAMNALAGRAVFQHADVVLVIGSRFVDALTPTLSWPAGRIRFIHINIDADDLGSPRTPEIAIAADAALVLPILCERVTSRMVISAEKAQDVKAWAQRQIDQIEPQASYIRALRQAIPEDGIFVNELTQVGYLARIAYPVYESRSYIGPGYQGTLGYGFPVALGAAVGAKGRRVVSITGDGGFGWNLQELATAQRYKLPITLIVFNDGHYGNVRAIQKREFGAEVAVDLANPDFGLLARAFGVAFESVDTPEALSGAVRQANSHDGPVMIEVKIGVVPSPWHLLRLQPMKGMTGPAAPVNPLGEVV